MADGLAPLAGRILQIVRDTVRAERSTAETVKIREEVIASVQEDGRATLRGYPHVVPPKSAQFKMAPGQRVHVLFRGAAPVLILGHNWKRAQVRPDQEGVLNVEELLLFDVGGGTQDLYFRNDLQITRLNLDAIINADVIGGDGNTGPRRPIWGEADNTFMVMAIAKETSGPYAGLYKPRFYVFRLSRPEKQAAGSAAVTATHVSTVDMPVFDLPTRFNFVQHQAPFAGSFPIAFPYMNSGMGAGTFNFIASILQSQALLTRALDVTMLVPFTTGTSGGLSVGLQFPEVEYIDYLIGVNSTASTVQWESQVSTTYRYPDPPAPTLLPPPLGFIPGSFYRVQLRGFASVSWNATTPADSLVATSWVVGKLDHLVQGTVTLDYYRSGTFIERSGAVAQTVQPFASIPAIVLPIPSGVQSVPQYVPVTASRKRVLWEGARITAGTAAAPTTQESWIAEYDIAAGTLTPRATLTGLPVPSLALKPRAYALREFDEGGLYVIDEDAANTFGSITPVTPTPWPPEQERGRFTILAGALPLNVDKVLPEDSTRLGRGVVKDLPDTLDEPDGYTERTRFAYHVVES